MSILIKDVRHQNRTVDIYIEDNVISEIGKVRVEADEVIDGRKFVALPGLVNAHTHAAMSLLRGYADDLPLQVWLNEKIWPVERNLRAEYVYWGTKLACLEMIKTGTTTFHDLYYFVVDAGKAVKEMGIRGVLAQGFLDFFDDERMEQQIETTREAVRGIRALRCDRVMPALGPHAVYTVSKEGFQWCKDYAEEENLLIHTHLSETEGEVKDAMKQFQSSPVKYLHKIGVLCDRVVAAHCVWLSDEDIRLIADRGATAVHCPISNMKLGVGRVMPYNRLVAEGVNVALGTDSASSNNNLDMLEEMKVAALLQKMAGDTTALPAAEVMEMATKNGAEALRINAGVLEEGKLADVILIDLKHLFFIPGYNIISDVVYSANGLCVDTTICDGRILMRDRVVEGEEEIIEKAKRIAMDYVSGR